MGKARDFFRKIRDTKGTFHAKMGSIKDRNGMDLTEAEDIKKRWQEYTEELYKKDFVAFNILSLSLIFVSLITVCLSMFLLGFILPGTPCFLHLVDYFLSHVRKVFSYYLFKYFLRSFLSSSRTPIMRLLCI